MKTVWFNNYTKEVSESKPTRIRLTDGNTLTNELVTDELLAFSGWEEIPSLISEFVVVNINSGTNVDPEIL